MATKLSAPRLKELRAELGLLQEEQVQLFFEQCAKNLAARLLRLVTDRTPVGQYPPGSGKVGGTLKRNWKFEGGQATVTKSGSVYRITIVNPTEYASYVEFGHRTRGGRGWVPGRFMLTISEQQIQGIAPALLQSRLDKMLREAIK